MKEEEQYSIRSKVVTTNTTEILMIGAAIAVGASGIGSTIGITMAGRAAEKTSSERGKLFGTNLVFTVLAETPTIYGLLIALIMILNASNIESLVTAGTLSEDQVFWGAMGASIVVGVTGFFSALGIGYAASAAITAMSRKEGIFGKSLVFVILPETIVIYGLLIAILITRSLGTFGDAIPVPVGNEIVLFLAAGVLTLVSLTGYMLGKLGASGISALVKSEATFGRNIVFVVLVESIAIYGVLVSILMLQEVHVI
jgi:V/A-type H+-transporting ATPase subunit K